MFSLTEVLTIIGHLKDFQALQATVAQINEQVARHEGRITLQEKLMSDVQTTTANQQAQIDAEAAQVTSINATLTADAQGVADANTRSQAVAASLSTVQAELADLKAQNATSATPLDFSKTDAAIATALTQANSLGSAIAAIDPATQAATSVAPATPAPATPAPTA